MINNFCFVQKNNVEIFKESCFELNQGFDTLIEKLNEIRETIYKCAHKQPRPLCDSTHDHDCIVINKLINSTNSQSKQEIYQRSNEVLYIYKQQFINLDREIQKKLKKICDLHQRNSLNRKMYDLLMIKRQELNNYFYSMQDTDSPTKIESDVFKF